MKNLTKIFTLFILICFLSPMKAQKFYEDQWKKIDANYQKGQFKSNLPIILEIQNRAIKDDNTIQLIKSLKSEFSVVNLTEDDTKNDAASQFFKKLQTFDQKLNGEGKLVYQVLLGDFFKDYYSQNQWEINQRTNINNQDFAQIETWSKLDFKNFFAKHFSELSKQDLALQKIQISKFAEIFSEVEEIAYFPAFFDYKSMQFIDYLQNRNYFTKNELKENQPKIINIYDELIAKYSGNSKLYFQHQKLNDDCAFTNCKNKQEQLLALYNSSTEGDYKVLIAQEIISNLQQKQKFEEALSWIEKVKNAYPKSKFLENIKNQENQIKQPYVTIKFEPSTMANRPIHLVSEYKNINQFSLNIYEVKRDYQGFMKFVYNSWQHENYTNLKKSLVRKENFDLPKTTDYKTHETSLEIKPLPSGIYVGEYIVEGKVQDKFYFIAANSRIIYQNKSDRKSLENQLKLVNRYSGKILPKENLEFYEFLQRQNLEKSSGNTDEKAVFNIPKSENQDYYRTILVRQPKTNDFNLIQAYGNQYGEDFRGKDVEQAQVFLDREIYRPGQIIYFKVIATAFNATKNTENVSSKVKLNVVLKDVNGEEISKQMLTTNDFGSVNGSFTLPQGKLNGQFSIIVDSDDVKNLDFSGEKYFRVEEYKRPKFEVTFEPLKDEYKYGQTIELQGKAMMFSGVPLSNSTVNYEIKKQNIRWRYFWWYPRGNDNENSILGEAITNEKGEFTIKLDLKKDETLEGIQIDNYEINASVTDINGETQSANTNLNVSSVSHYIALFEVKNDYFTDENVKAKVETKNYNDQNLKKNYTARLSKLTSPERIFRTNFENEIQNLPVLSKSDFVQKFPFDYFDKSEKENKIEKIAFEKNQESLTNLELGKLSAGKYKLELFNIEGKDTIKTEKVFEVFDKAQLLDNQKTFLKILPAKAEYNRTEKAKFYVYSAVPDALVNVYVQNGDGKTQFEQLPIKKGFLVYETALPKDESIDQLNVQFQLVAFNDVQTETENVKITSNKKPLKIELVTFRDKLQPNSKEKWTIKLSGEDKEKVTAEVLANMYDKSLDQFAVNSYSWQSLYQKPFWFTDYNIKEGLSLKYYNKRLKYFNNERVKKPQFDWFDRGIVYLSGKANGLIMAESSAPAANMKIRGMDSMKGEAVTDSVKTKDIEEVVALGYAKKKDKNLENIKVRQNLNETAFFYPNLMTDKDGNVSFEFTSPEALTQWKLMFLAHTKDARSATLEKTVVTQKEFSVTPNYPRFLREGDELIFKSKLSNLTTSQLNGVAQLQILDAFTNEDISSKFDLKDIQKSFVLNANGNTTVQWKVKAPNGVSSIIIKNVAKAGQFSDGEQKAIAVLPNRMLVTDAVSVFVKEGQTKTFVLENLKNNTSKTATNVSNTLELTTNPIWEVIFALPSLKNETNLSADVVFNKWFADVLASEIFKANPKMKTVFDEYQAKGLLNSNIEKNQELKQLLLEETPWVLDAKNETEQMQKLARLFDANNMRNSINDDWSELKKLQNPDGGFSWYAGYPSSYYNSLYILKNLGRINEWLKGNLADYQSSEQKEMVSQLVKYVDSEVSRYFDVNAVAERSRSNVWSNYVLDYLDTRHYWEKEFPLKSDGKKMKDLVISKAKTAKITDFTFFGFHRAALLFDAYNLKDISKKLLTYLKETSVQSETQGVYWKQNLNDWGWYSSKTVNHAGALEAFNKLTTDQNFVEEMKIWLITQKEVSNWDTSRSTAEVIYTILNSGKSWTSAESDKATIIWGGKDLVNPDTKATGYVKSAVNSDKIDKNLASVTITKPGAGIVQGGLFWQYYEDLDKIKSSENYISITKELYKKVKTVNGEELQKITENAPLKIGDKVTVRMILNTDRNMEFIHLKDMRAAGFEPVDVLSGYQWKNNLGYYQVTKDASTNFYIEFMPKGKYVFEYDYICNAAGTFSNGITTMQNYYAPQMNAHTQGTKVSIKEN